MDRVKKRLAYLLAMVLLLALLAPAAPAVTAFAATKNPITELGVKKLPEGNTIKVGEVFNFDPDIIATERGKGKSTGVVWWEINAKTNTAGVSSSRWGYVYPVYAGSFEIRALSFANTKDLNAWKAARKANGYVAEEAVTASYATAMTDWVKIDVVSDMEGYAVARSQYQLGLALKNRKVKEIHIQTDKSICFTIGRKSYVQRTLVVDAPNAEVENAGRFAQINIKQIKASTFTEKAYGNRFHVTAPDARIVFVGNARTNEVVFEPGETAETNRLTLVGEGGMLSELDVKAAGNVDIVGSIFADRSGKAVVVNVAEEAAGTSIQTDAALEVNAAADVAVTVNKTEESETIQGKRKTVINMEKAVKVSVDGTAADGTTVVVKDGAKGSEIASDAALVIVANADVTLNLTENAAGTTVTKGENVKVDLSAESKVDGVSITDVNGTVETIKPGEDSPEVTIAPSATPVPTTAPSGGSSGGWIPPVTTSTPAPTAIPTSGASYTLDGKSTGVSFASGSKEAVVALPADSSSKTVTLTVNGNSVQKALVVGVNAVSIGEYTVKFIVPVESVKISASLSDVKISTVSGSAVTGSAILVVKVKDDLSAFTADPDFDVSYEWKIGDTVTPDISGTVYQKAVEVAVNGNLITYAEAGAYSVAVKVNHSKAGEALTMKSGSLKIDFRMQEGEEPEITPTPVVTPTPPTPDYVIPEDGFFLSGNRLYETADGEIYPEYILQGKAEDEVYSGHYLTIADFVDLGFFNHPGYKYVVQWNGLYYPIVVDTRPLPDEWTTVRLTFGNPVDSLMLALDESVVTEGEVYIYIPGPILGNVDGVFTWGDVYEWYNGTKFFYSDGKSIYGVKLHDLYSCADGNITIYVPEVDLEACVDVQVNGFDVTFKWNFPEGLLELCDISITPYSFWYFDDFEGAAGTRTVGEYTVKNVPPGSYVWRIEGKDVNGRGFWIENDLIIRDENMLEDEDPNQD